MHGVSLGGIYIFVFTLTEVVTFGVKVGYLCCGWLVIFNKGMVLLRMAEPWECLLI